jgi:hypothetical protein
MKDAPVRVTEVTELGRPLKRLLRPKVSPVIRGLRYHSIPGDTSRTMVSATVISKMVSDDEEEQWAVMYVAPKGSNAQTRIVMDIGLARPKCSRTYRRWEVYLLLEQPA